MTRRLPKEKRDKLILVSLGTLAVLIVIGLGLIRPQYQAINRMRAQTNDARAKLQGMEDSINQADITAAQLHDISDTLAQQEKDMAIGDPNAWIYDTLRRFKSKYKVDMTIGNQTSISEVDLLPRFPYRQLKVTVNGSAYYHDLGTFIADFENNFPHARICNLIIEPSGGSGDNLEKLNFRMEIIALVKPNET